MFPTNLTVPLWEILIPINDNVLHYVTEASHRRIREWQEKVAATTGGLTILKSRIGEYVSTHHALIKEPMLPILIACTEKDILSIADFTASFFHQDAIMFYQVSPLATIRTYPSEA